MVRPMKEQMDELMKAVEKTANDMGYTTRIPISSYDTDFKDQSPVWDMWISNKDNVSICISMYHLIHEDD